MDDIPSEYSPTKTTNVTTQTIYSSIFYDPTFSTVLDSNLAPVIKNITFSIENGSRIATLEFDDTFSKEVAWTYYAEGQITSTSYRYQNISIVDPNNPTTGEDGIWQQTGTPTTLPDARSGSSSITTLNKTVSFVCLPNVGYGGTNPVYITDTGTYTNWINDTRYTEVEFKNSKYRNVLIYVRYTGQSIYSYYFMHFKVNRYIAG